MKLFQKKNRTNAAAPDLRKDIVREGLSEEEIARLEAEAVLEKYDRESSFRNKLPVKINNAISAVLILFSLFQLYTTLWTIPIQKLRPIHLGFVLLLVFLLYPAARRLRKDRIPWYDAIMAFMALGCVLYIPFNYEYVIQNVGNYTPMDIAVGVVGILLLMEACRRVVGLPILIIVTGFLLYALLGENIPGTFGHRGYSIKQIINHMYFTTSGVFGTPLGVSATFIFLFILFGAFLEELSAHGKG